MSGYVHNTSLKILKCWTPALGSHLLEFFWRNFFRSKWSWIMPLHWNGESSSLANERSDSETFRFHQKRKPQVMKLKVKEI